MISNLSNKPSVSFMTTNFSVFACSCMKTFKWYSDLLYAYKECQFKERVYIIYHKKVFSRMSSLRCCQSVLKHLVT